jgi:glycosyltransferase involved in cell wall biosynthesis
MEKAKPIIVACIPAYNEEKNIARVIVGAQKHVDRVVVCDDGSNDMTSEIAEKLGARVIRHERNMGYGAALATLFRNIKEAKVDVMVTLDGDGQHDPEEIPKVVSPILGGEADIVVGSRFMNGGGEKVPRYRKSGIKAITKISNTLSDSTLTDAQSGFRAYSGRALDLIDIGEMGMGASTEIIMKAREHGLKVQEVPIIASYFKEPSKSLAQNPIYHGVDVVLSTIKHLSIRHPLLFYGVPGLTSLIISVYFWLWTIDLYVSTRAILTNVALVAVATTVFGLILMTSAIMLWVIISVIREKQ